MWCRDHRKLGQELDLFSIEAETAGGGLVFWHPNGAAIRNILENFWKVRPYKLFLILEYSARSSDSLCNKLQFDQLRLEL